MTQSQQGAKTTYDGSNGVAGCDALKLCAKLIFPPSCLADPGGTLALPPMGMPPPNAHPAGLPTGPVQVAESAVKQSEPEGARGTPHLSSHSVTCSTLRDPLAAAVVVGRQTRRAYRVAPAGQPLDNSGSSAKLVHGWRRTVMMEEEVRLETVAEGDRRRCHSIGGPSSTAGEHRCLSWESQRELH